MLLVEDADHKAELIESLVREVLGSAEVFRASSFREGLTKATRHEARWALIILDMTLPSYAATVRFANRERPYAGMEILYQLKLRGVTTPVVVVTQYDVFGEGDREKTLEQLRVELESSFGQQYLGAIYFSPSDVAWKQELSRILYEQGDC